MVRVSNGSYQKGKGFHHLYNLGYMWSIYCEGLNYKHSGMLMYPHPEWVIVIHKKVGTTFLFSFFFFFLAKICEM